MQRYITCNVLLYFCLYEIPKKHRIRPLRPRPGGPTHIGTSIVTKHPYPPIRGSWLLLMSSSPDPGFTNFMSQAHVPTPCSSPGLHVYSHPSTPSPERSMWWCGRKYQACAPSKESVLKPCLSSARLEQLGPEKDQIRSEVTILQRKMDTVMALMDQIQVLTALDDGSESNAWRPYSGEQCRQPPPSPAGSELSEISNSTSEAESRFFTTLGKASRTTSEGSEASTLDAADGTDCAHTPIKLSESTVVSRVGTASFTKVISHGGHVLATPPREVKVRYVEDGHIPDPPPLPFSSPTQPEQAQPAGLDWAEMTNRTDEDAATHPDEDAAADGTKATTTRTETGSSALCAETGRAHYPNRRMVGREIIC